MPIRPNFIKTPTYIAPKDTLEVIQADQTFLAKIAERVAIKEIELARRMFMSREDIRNLRRLVGFSTSSQWLDRIKNRRMRVGTVKQFLVKAEDNLAARAAALVSEKIHPVEPTKWPDVALDERTMQRWSQTLYNRVHRNQLVP